MTIAAILRDGNFSPNHIASDAAILHDCVAELRRKGFQVNTYSEYQFAGTRIDEDIILAMCRGRKAIEKLQKLEDEGRIVVNSGYGIENCIRMFMIPKLRTAGVKMPESMLVDTDTDVRGRLKTSGFDSAWVKIADDHLHHLEDVSRCRHAEEVQEILHEFFYRGIRKALVSRTEEGMQVRFYGVASTGWFHAFMPYEKGSGAMTDESEDALSKAAREECFKAAGALGVDVFGGDMVVTPQGDCLLMNFDDWPSFAPIRKEAAKAIAKSVLARARKLMRKKK